VTRLIASSAPVQCRRNGEAAFTVPPTYIAPGGAKHAGDGEGGGARIAAMRAKIKAGGHASPYCLRKQLPKPVFGQIKQARGLRQFLLRGVEKVAAEWDLVYSRPNRRARQRPS
jgi:hypothetical protein